jgi:hypothetical protein
MAKQRLTLVLVAVALLLIPAFPFASAQDPEGPYCTTNPDDGTGLPECYTPEDNECYEGGELEFRCFEPAHWVIGWYLARYNQGLIGADDMPEWVALSLFPPGPPVVSRPRPRGTRCLNLGPVGMPHIDILLDVSVDHQIAPIFFANTACTEYYPNGTPPAINFAVVFAVGQANAEAKCTTYFSLGAATDYTAAYPDLWRCSKY